MVNIKEEELKMYKPLKAKIDKISCTLTEQEIQKEFPLLEYTQARKETEAALQHLSYYVTKYHVEKNIPVENVSENLMKKFKATSQTLKVMLDHKKAAAILSQLNGIEVAYSDWTNQEIGYQAKLRDGTIFLFLNNKDEVLTSRKTPLDIEKVPILSTLLDNQIIYYAK